MRIVSHSIWFLLALWVSLFAFDASVFAQNLATAKITGTANLLTSFTLDGVRYEAVVLTGAQASQPRIASPASTSSTKTTIS
jgi:hypothetical protein